MIGLYMETKKIKQEKKLFVVFMQIRSAQSGLFVGF